MFSTYLVANEIGYKEVYSKGRAVITENNVDIAKKRALEDALYLASLQGGARVDGYSNIDASTSLRPIQNSTRFAVMKRTFSGLIFCWARSSRLELLSIPSTK